MLHIITGRPGIGKSTVCRRVIELLRDRSLKIGGVICPEVRSNRVRIGFKIIDLMTGREGWLAHVNFNTGIRVGKYQVNLKDLNEIGVSAIKNAMKSADVIVIDEVGPMELKSSEFKKVVFEAFKSSKPVIAVVHWRLSSWIASSTKELNPRIYRVNMANRDRLHEEIFRNIMSELKAGGTR